MKGTCIKSRSLIDFSRKAMLKTKQLQTCLDLWPMDLQSRVVPWSTQCHFLGTPYNCHYCHITVFIRAVYQCIISRNKSPEIAHASDKIMKDGKVIKAATSQIVCAPPPLEPLITQSLYWLYSSIGYVACKLYRMAKYYSNPIYFILFNKHYIWTHKAVLHNLCMTI